MAVVVTKLSLLLLYSPLVVGLALLVGFCVYISYQKRRTVKLLGHYVYTMPSLPIMGNYGTLMTLGDTTGFWNFITEQTTKHREGVLFSVFHLNWIFIQEVDVVEAVLMSQENCDKSYVYSLLDPITEGVFACNGVKWRKLRKKLNLTFSQKQIDMYWDEVNQQAAVCVDSLSQHQGKYINVRSFLAAFFVDIIFRSHFGIQTKEQITRKHQITEHAGKIIEVTMQYRFFNVFLHPIVLYNWSRLCHFIRHYRDGPLTWMRKLIDKRLKEEDMDANKALKDDSDRKRLYFVDMVREVLPQVNVKPTPYTIERNTSDIVVAASDTTSVTVSTLIYYLSIYPDMQERIYQEVAPIFGQSRTKVLTKEDLNKMEYLEMAIKETLRLTAPPGIVREIPRDTDVGKYVLPKGINTFIALKAIHENPAYWEKPTQFYPEHFLPEKVSQRPKYAFVPFSLGPRNCPGMAFSYVTMKTVASHIIRNFKLETDVPLEKIKFKMVLMQEFEDSFRIKLTSRPQ